jgi:hypothetical protein
MLTLNLRKQFGRVREIALVQTDTDQDPYGTGQRGILFECGPGLFARVFEIGLVQIGICPHDVKVGIASHRLIDSFDALSGTRKVFLQKKTVDRG